MITDQNEWIHTNSKPLRHPKNKEFVTARVNIINGKKVIFISIGLIVCELIELVKGDRVNIFINKIDRNLILLKKSIIPHYGYKLSHATDSNGNLMHFSFRYQTEESFRLSQTIILDYEIGNDKSLLLNFEKIKWNN